ncbi:ExbD/TolR family protein [Aquimonas sp.]|uniref:ExbD/TolR family protein n=1 Tax=Aquimonas sp. TaxID=1872588 RepID=UPI0037BE70AF
MFASDSDSSEFAGINVTPLVDVMLVLLILFMISAPLVMQRLDLPLPQATPQPSPEVTNKLELRMDAAGVVWMGGRELSRAALRGVLTLEAGRGDTPILSIDASPEAPYQAVAEVLSLAQNVGLDKLELLGR